MTLSNINTAVFIATCLISSIAQALPNDAQQPISVEADKAFFDQKNGTATYNGNVLVKQGSIVIKAESLNLITNPQNGEFKSLKATGTPSTFTQTLNENGQIMNASGNHLTYDVGLGELEIHDAGHLQRGDDEITADYIHYLLKTGTFKAENRGTGRVNMTLQPSTTK